MGMKMRERSGECRGGQRKEREGGRERKRGKGRGIGRKGGTGRGGRRGGVHKMSGDDG